LSSSARRIRPGETQEVEMEVDIPSDESPGRYRISVTATNRESGKSASGNTTHIILNDEIEKAEIETRPQIFRDSDVVRKPSFRGRIIDLGGDEYVTARFEYGKTRELGERTTRRTYTSPAYISSSIDAHNLEPDTKYYYRFVADNIAGRAYGDIETFTTTDFIDCLADREVVIYSNKTCPACIELAEIFGGYDRIEPIYVDCVEEARLCERAKKTGYVPEIQIRGDLYRGERTPGGLARATGCSW